MRKVVDTSALRSSEVIQYLAASTKNEVMIPQLVLCECMQGDGVRNARQSLVGIARYSDQAYVLKSEKLLTSLLPRSSGLQKRLVDERLTSGLRKNLLYNLTREGELARAVDAMMLHDEAQADSVNKNYSDIAGGGRGHMRKMREWLSAEDISAIRNRKLSANVIDRVEQLVMAAVIKSFEKQGLDPQKINCWDATYAWYFRWCLAIEALAIDWIAFGGLDGRSEQSITNDVKDMNHVAYSTFFDGILALDKRLLRVAGLTRILIKMFEERYAHSRNAIWTPAMNKSESN